MFLQMPRLSYLGSIPPGKDGTVVTLRLMSRMVTRYKRRSEVRETALSLIADVAPKNWRGEVNALFVFVRDHIRYTRDIRGVETLQIPTVTLDLSSGDCDDKSTLLASLLESVGHPTRFVAVGYKSPDSYSHVYVESRINNRWVALDATMPHAIGWAPREPLSRMVVENKD